MRYEGVNASNEATVRWKIDIILQACVRTEQKHIAMKELERKKRPVTLTAETQLECKFIYRGETFLLVGYLCLPQTALSIPNQCPPRGP